MQTGNLNPAAHPLSRHPIVSTRDPELAAEELSRFQAPVRVARIADKTQFQLDMNGRRCGRIFLGYNEFGTDTVLDPGTLEDVVGIVIGRDRNRPSHFELDDERVTVSSSRAAIVSPGQRGRIWRPRNSGVFVIGLPPTVVAARYEQLTGRRPTQRIAFRPSADLKTGPGRQLVDLTRELATELDRAERDARPSLLAPVLEDAIVSLCLGLPNNLSDEFSQPSYREVAPWVVRRAEDYIVAHAADAISVSEIVAACGCSQRALFATFKSSRGYTPMQFLAMCRLDLAYRKLREEPDKTATDIAYECGFGNYGRFARAYRQRFGVSPSETRLRSFGTG